MINEVKLCDNMDYMKTVPDGYFELAIVDPPYGIGEDGGKFRGKKGEWHRVLEKKEWDKETPPQQYFNELFRISQNQIIWGGNYFTDKVPVSRCWLYWDKLMSGDFSDGELAWTSFDKVLKKFTMCNKYHGKIHPTQKPVALYKWILKNYAKPGYKIFDSHVGSGSSRIACYDMGFDFIGCEKDEDYWNAQEKRYHDYTAQASLFSGAELQKEMFKET